MRQTMKKQSGYTLTEMLIAIAVLASVMAIAAGILHGLITANRAARDGLLEQTAFARLAETFRADARASVGWSDPPAAAQDAPTEKTQWTFKQSDESEVLYRVESGCLVRQAETPSGVVRRDFALPRNAAITIETSAEQEPELVMLVVRPGQTPAGTQASAVRGLRVVVQLGRDRVPAERVLETPSQTPEPGNRGDDQTPSQTTKETTDE